MTGGQAVERLTRDAPRQKSADGGSAALFKGS